MGQTTSARGHDTEDTGPTTAATVQPGSERAPRTLSQRQAPSMAHPVTLDTVPKAAYDGHGTAPPGQPTVESVPRRPTVLPRPSEHGRGTRERGHTDAPHWHASLTRRQTTSPTPPAHASPLRTLSPPPHRCETRTTRPCAAATGPRRSAGETTHGIGDVARLAHKGERLDEEGAHRVREQVGRTDEDARAGREFSQRTSEKARAPEGWPKPPAMWLARPARSHTAPAKGYGQRF